MSPHFLHADLDSFFASVEQRDNPKLRGIPMAVGGGVILAASYEAKAYGVNSPMGIRKAREACPNLVVVPPRMDAYLEASKQVFEVFNNTSPFVEPISVDEAFLDVTGLRRIVGGPDQIASNIRKSVQDEVGLAISVGGAATKFLAKVASASAKPDGLLIVEEGKELEFLHPLPIRRLWGVGPATAEKLHSKGLFTVGQIAELDHSVLAGWLGAGAAGHLHALANNSDPRRVVVGKRRTSVGAQRALARGLGGHGDIEAVLLELVDRVTRRLRDGNRVGRTASLRFRFGDFRSDARSLTLGVSTASTAEYLDAGRRLLESRWGDIDARGLTMLGFTIGNLSDADAVQQRLPFDDLPDPNLDPAIDSVRKKFGSDAIGRAALVGKAKPLEMPLLPDPQPVG